LNVFDSTSVSNSEHGSHSIDVNQKACE